MKIFNKILLSSVIIFIIASLILFILGRIEREGYLSDFFINADDTLKLNNIDVEDTKKLFYVNNELDYSSLTNYIFTNFNISRYSYNFRITYYSKVFRNSDIYGVYLNTNSLPNYITEIKFQENGTPFGILTSSKKIEGNINNVQYVLKLKYTFLIILLASFILLNIIIYFFIKNLYYFQKLLYRMSNINRYVCILIIFLCFLIMPNIIYKIFYDKFDHTNYENRNLSSKPILDIKHLSIYPKLYETYFNDYIPFRNELIQLKNLIDIVLFNNIISEMVTLGINNWMFIDNWPNDDWNQKEKFIGLDKYDFTTEELELSKNYLLDIRDKLKKLNIDFIFVIFPYKQHIYDKYMPSYIKRKTDITATDKFVKYIKNNTDLKIVYPKQELLKYRDKYQLYYKYDTHWNGLGAYIGYKELMNIVNINVPSLDSLKIVTNYNYPLDLIDLINLHKVYESNHDTNYYVKYNENIKYDLVDSLNSLENVYEIYKSESTNTNYIYIVGDSYLGYMKSYISRTFQKFQYKSKYQLYYSDDDVNFIINNDRPNMFVLQTVDADLKGMMLELFMKKLNIDIEVDNITKN
ncbi:hypothetical protein R4J03_05080 [Brachyspira intermedia]|uniref:alginate O-acetyltransferase AlgX-related protein n=1 Tax=Brachyspira intermedia TaxID=84377 RepID=UPI0030064E99